MPVLNAHGNKRGGGTGENQSDDSHLAGPHFVPIIGAFGENRYPLPLSEKLNDAGERTSTFQGLLAVQRNSPEGGNEPVAERIVEELIFRYVIEGPGGRYAKERNVLPSLMFG